MRILQIGLGSMGKRRVRNMAALGVTDVIGFDLQETRRAGAAAKYGITTVAELTPELLAEREAYVISTPPAHHLPYIRAAIEHARPAFVEASVLSEGLPEASADARERGVLIAPSCTFRFHPAVRVIKGLVHDGSYGKVTNFTYTMGQYLPDWHPWEDIRDFYVSARETSAAREMVPFELTWLVDVVGWPSEVLGFRGSTMDLGVDIDDTYAMALRFSGGQLGTMLVDVVARSALRSLVLNMERGQVRWSWGDAVVRVYDAGTGEWSDVALPQGRAAEGYNTNIIEEMYIDEMGAFVRAVRGEEAFPNTLDEDIRVLRIMEAAERTARGERPEEADGE